MKWAKLLAGRKLRARVHAGVLLLVATAIVVSDLVVEPELVRDLLNKYPSEDKLLHYQAGRIITAVMFFLAYCCIVLRVLLVGERQGSITKLLLWMPTLFVGSFLLAVAVAVFFAMGKEVFDFGGSGVVEWLDFEATIDGAATMIPSIGIVMAITPFFVPLDMILQMPKLLLADVSTGYKAVDRFMREHHKHKNFKGPLKVLVVDNDLESAGSIMNYYREIGIRCEHVDNIVDAERVLRENLNTIRLLVLENFLHVTDKDNSLTGVEWFQALSVEFPPQERSFHVMVLTGHIELLGPGAELADMTVQKPWNPDAVSELVYLN